jgi:acetone carboxylase gamma subunit
VGLPVGDHLSLCNGRWACRCGEDLGPQDRDYKAAAVLRPQAVDAVGPEFTTDDPEMAGLMVLRQWLCPGCGVRIDAELARRTDPVLHDVAIFETV